MFRLIVALCFLASISSQELRCPEVERQKKVNPSKLGGIWYLQAVYSNAEIANQQCTAYNFKLDEEPPAVEISYVEPGSEELSSTLNLVNVVNISETSEVLIEEENSQWEKWIVVSADYGDELILHACNEEKYEKNLGNEQTTMVLYRTDERVPNRVSAVETYLAFMNINLDYKMLVDHSDCLKHRHAV